MVDVAAAFNAARSSENALLGTFLKPMVAPSGALWGQMSEGERVLWLVNEERTVRGLAPLQGLETNANEVAQGYAGWLLANNQFDHEADGRTPWQRLDAKPAIAACHDSLSIAENLYWQGTTSSDGIPLVMEQAVYALIYMDATSQWGHRHAMLWTSYNARSWMIYGPFSLQNAISAMVQAKVWVYTELDNDMLCMMVSTDDGMHFSGTCFSGNSHGWVDEQLDLSRVYEVGNVVGQVDLYIGFVFLSNESLTRELGGAYVDNITLSQGVMSPGSALYGVTITTEDGHATVTDQAGNYSLVGLSPGKHLLTPSKEGYQFHPSSLDVDLSTGDVVDTYFIGTPSLTVANLPYSLHMPLIRPR